MCFTSMHMSQFAYFYGLAICPDTFQVIEQAVLFRKNMDNDISVIHQDPAGIAVSFDLLCLIAAFAQLLSHCVYQGLDLVGVCGGCDNEIICQCRNPSNVYYPDIFCLFSLNAWQAAFAISRDCSIYILLS